MVYVPQISMAETPEMMLGLVLAVSAPIAFVMEIFGLSLGYSKFAGVMDKTTGIPSQLGMFMLYFPVALMVYVCMHFSAEKGAVEDSTLHHCCLIMVGGHFFKRCAEVLFVHKYSGVMNVLTCILVSLGYASMSGILATTAIYRLPLNGLPKGYHPGNIAMGSTMWLLGQGGNFYHHWLLANLRKNDADKRYKVPKGGLFPLLCCPHYTCELVAWAGFAVVLNHAAAFCLLSFFVLYLLGRGRSTKLWYLQRQAQLDGKLPSPWFALVPFVW